MDGNFPIPKLPPMAVGQRYGRLTAVGRNGSTMDGAAKWLFYCDCGEEITAIAKNVRRGITASCGCLRRETTAEKNRVSARHSMTGTREHRTWLSMLQRCRDHNHTHYNLYGGRGIKVCDRWLVFENFLEDMGLRPPGKTLDRYPNKDGDYERGNCRWATASEQNSNRRSFRRQRLVAESL